MATLVSLIAVLDELDHDVLHHATHDAHLPT